MNEDTVLVIVPFSFAKAGVASNKSGFWLLLVAGLFVVKNRLPPSLENMPPEPLLTEEDLEFLFGTCWDTDVVGSIYQSSVFIILRNIRSFNFLRPLGGTPNFLHLAPPLSDTLQCQTVQLSNS